MTTEKSSNASRLISIKLLLQAELILLPLLYWTFRWYTLWDYFLFQGCWHLKQNSPNCVMDPLPPEGYQFSSSAGVPFYSNAYSSWDAVSSAKRIIHHVKHIVHSKTPSPFLLKACLFMKCSCFRSLALNVQASRNFEDSVLRSFVKSLTRSQTLWLK